VSELTGAELTAYIAKKKAEILAKKGPLAPEVLIRLAPTDEIAQAAATTRAALEAGLLHGGDGLVALDYLDKLDRELHRRKERADVVDFWRRQGQDRGLGGVDV